MRVLKVKLVEQEKLAEEATRRITQLEREKDLLEG